MLIDIRRYQINYILKYIIMYLLIKNYIRGSKEKYEYVQKKKKAIKEIEDERTKPRNT